MCVCVCVCVSVQVGYLDRRGEGESPDWEKLSQVEESVRGCGIMRNGHSGVCRDSVSHWAKGNSSPF